MGLIFFDVKMSWRSKIEATKVNTQLADIDRGRTDHSPERGLLKLRPAVSKKDASFLLTDRPRLYKGSNDHRQRLQ
jgi:ribosomal protein L35AE/L33A